MSSINGSTFPYRAGYSENLRVVSFSFISPTRYSRSFLIPRRRLLPEESVGAQSKDKCVDRDVEWTPLSFARVLPNFSF